MIPEEPGLFGQIRQLGEGGGPPILGNVGNVSLNINSPSEF